MIINASQLPQDREYDVCVVGAGPAGISVALKLASRNVNVVLLEGGSDRWTPESQEIYKGSVIGDTYFPLDQTRLRFLGGASNHWGGNCHPLDPLDFEKKLHKPKAVWPIAKSDLDPYLAEACSILDISLFPADREIGYSGLRALEFRQSSVNFGTKYRQWLERDSRITLVLEANVTSLETDGKHVTRVRLATVNSQQGSLRAKAYVVAVGGIENSRLLLWSNELARGHLVAKNAPLGKYWMEHPHFRLGDALLVGEAAFALPADGGEIYFAPTIDSVTEDGTLNCNLSLRKMNYRSTKKLVSDLACVVPNLGLWASDMMGYDLTCGAKIQGAWEQEPLESNYIELGADRDRFGVPRVTLHWRKSKFDLRTAKMTVTRFGEFLARTGNGRARVRDWVLEDGPFPNDSPKSGNHHMGGTRMATNSDDGVVDANCRVFGQENLYVAGSSTFPSGGHANPTFTIIQLALRLGNHLAEQIAT